MNRTAAIVLLLVAVLIPSSVSAKTIRVTFGQVEGLRQEDPVILENRTVGKVVDVLYTRDAQYRVTLHLKPETAGEITEYARFLITSDSDPPERRAVEVVVTRSGGDPLADGAEVRGTTRTSLWMEQFSSSLDQWTQTLQEQLDGFAEKARKIPDSEAYQKLQKQLDELSERLGEAGRVAGERFREDVLPRLQEQLDELREKLEKEKPSKTPPEGVEV